MNDRFLISALLLGVSCVNHLFPLVICFMSFLLSLHVSLSCQLLKHTEHIGCHEAARITRSLDYTPFEFPIYCQGLMDGFGRLALSYLSPLLATLVFPLPLI